MQTLTLEQILPAGVTILAGRPLSGKTSLALGLAVAIAAEERALGCLPVSGGNVLYLCLDGRPDQLVQRAVRCLGGRETLPHAFEVAEDCPRTQTAFLAWLREWAEASAGPRCVVADSYTRLHARAGALGYAENWALLGDLARFGRERGVAVLLTHHTPKRSDDDGLSGSSVACGTADALWTIDRLGDVATLLAEGRGFSPVSLPLAWDAARMTWRSAAQAEARP